MFLKKLALILVFGFIVSGDTYAQKDNPVFEFTDGYFTSSYGPVHLVHDEVDLRVSLGEEYHLRVGFKVNVGASNPCSRREEKKCRLIQQVIAKGADGKEEFVAGWKVGLEFSVGSEKIGADGELVNFGIPSITIPRTSPTENTFLMVKIVKEDQGIYLKEWPIEIR